MKKNVCCDLTEKLADLDAGTAISSDFRFRLRDLPKKMSDIFSRQIVAINFSH